MTLATNKKISLKPKLSTNSVFEGNSVKITLPLRTISEANNSDHWTKKNKRHKKQQLAVTLMLKPLKEKITLPCHIKLTRLAPRKLDKHDNLPISLKWVLDACCATITGDFRPGRADDDERISISYDQIISKKYGVILEFTMNAAGLEPACQ